MWCHVKSTKIVFARRVSLIPRHLLEGFMESEKTLLGPCWRVSVRSAVGPDALGYPVGFSCQEGTSLAFLFQGIEKQPKGQKRPRSSKMEFRWGFRSHVLGAEVYKKRALARCQGFRLQQVRKLERSSSLHTLQQFPLHESLSGSIRSASHGE